VPYASIHQHLNRLQVIGGSLFDGRKDASSAGKVIGARVIQAGHVDPWTEISEVPAACLHPQRVWRQSDYRQSIDTGPGKPSKKRGISPMTAFTKIVLAVVITSTTFLS